MLQDANESPTIVTNELVVGELASAGTLVGTLQVNDPETYQSHTFAWADGFLSNEFILDPDSGDVFFAENASLIFAEQSEYFVDITATDNGVPPLATTKEVKIRLLDENNPPAIEDLDLNRQRV